MVVDGTCEVCAGGVCSCTDKAMVYDLYLGAQWLVGGVMVLLLMFL